MICATFLKQSLGLHQDRCFACGGDGLWEKLLPDDPVSFPWRGIQKFLLGHVKVELNGFLELLDQSRPSNSLT